MTRVKSTMDRAGPNAQERRLTDDLGTLLKAGVKGVMVDCWWGRVEAEGPGQYYWDGYKRLFEIVRDIGLDLHVVMSFHACGGNVGDNVNIPLPGWVKSIGEHEDLFYKDEHGNPSTEYLSWAVDNERVLSGNQLSPLQVYGKFMERFRTEMNTYFGEPQEREIIKKGKITKIEVGLGPSGELRYPAYRRPWTIGPPAGIGEFQCYDKYMMESWKNTAEEENFIIPDRVGPQTAGDYNSTPWKTQFFQSGAGLTNASSYTEIYGKTFLNWYSENLVDHGRKVLEIADQIFKPVGVETAAKVPAIYWYCNDPSCAAEATAGLINGHRDRDRLSVYKSITDLLNKLGATFIFTSVEKKDVFGNNTDKPQQLVQQVLGAVLSKGASIACENGSKVNDEATYNRIITVARIYKISYFTYRRLGPELMVQKNLDLFKKFVTAMKDGTNVKLSEETSPSEAQGP